MFFNTVAENGSTSSSNRLESDDRDDSDSTPTIVIGIIAGIAIIALIVIGVIILTFCIRYVRTLRMFIVSMFICNAKLMHVSIRAYLLITFHAYVFTYI